MAEHRLRFRFSYYGGGKWCSLLEKREVRPFSRNALSDLWSDTQINCTVLVLSNLADLHMADVNCSETSLHNILCESKGQNTNHNDSAEYEIEVESEVVCHEPNILKDAFCYMFRWYHFNKTNKNQSCGQHNLIWPSDLRKFEFIFTANTAPTFPPVFSRDCRSFFTIHKYFHVINTRNKPSKCNKHQWSVFEQKHTPCLLTAIHQTCLQLQKWQIHFRCIVLYH